jgi:hypothetical protein
MLNNRSAQGNFEKNSFFELLKDPEFDMAEAGFTNADLTFEFGELPQMEEGIAPPVTLAQAEDSAAAQIKQDLEELKEKKREGRRRLQNSPQADTDYFLMVAFGSREQKEQWLRSRKLSEFSRFVNAAEVFSDVADPLTQGA